MAGDRYEGTINGEPFSLPAGFIPVRKGERAQPTPSVDEGEEDWYRKAAEIGVGYWQLQRQFADLAREFFRMGSEAAGEERQAPNPEEAAEERGRRQAFEVAGSEIRRVATQQPAEPTNGEAG